MGKPPSRARPGLPGRGTPLSSQRTSPRRTGRFPWPFVPQAASASFLRRARAGTTRTSGRRCFMVLSLDVVRGEL